MRVIEMSRMKRLMKVQLGWMMMVILLVGSVTVINADAGPKPSITIHAENVPGSVVYMDLLIENGLTDFEVLEDADSYNQDMLAALRNYDDGMWKPAISAGAEFLLFGNIECQVVDGQVTNTFSYIGVPDRYKIIVVTEDLEVIVSNVIERQTFQSRVTFDLDTGEAKEQGAVSFIWQFFPALILTLLIEFLLLFAFRFSLKKSWKPVLIVNIITQIILHIVVTWGVLIGGIFLALILYFLMEWVIITGESIAYARLLKEHSLGRRIGYAVLANFISFFVGVFVVLVGML